MQDVKTPYLKTNRLWFGVIGPPAMWAVHLFFVWSVVEMGCRLGLNRNQWGGINAVHAIVLIATVVAVVLIVLAGISAYYSYRQIQAAHSEEQLAHSRALGRGQFMALTGMAFTVIFLTVVIYMTIPAFVLPPCDLL